MIEQTQNNQIQVKTHAHLYGLCLGNKLLEAHILVFNPKTGNYDLSEIPSCQMPAMTAISPTGEILSGYRAKNFWYAHKEAPVFYGAQLYNAGFEPFSYKGIRFEREELCQQLFNEFSTYLDSFLGKGYKECFVTLPFTDNKKLCNAVISSLRKAGLRPVGIAASMHTALCTRVFNLSARIKEDIPFAVGFSVDHGQLLLSCVRFANGIAEEVTASEIEKEIEGDILAEFKTVNKSEQSSDHSSENLLDNSSKESSENSSDSSSKESSENLSDNSSKESSENLLDNSLEKSSQTPLENPVKEFLALSDEEKTKLILKKYRSYISWENDPMVLHFKNYEKFAARGAVYHMMKLCGLKQNFPEIERIDVITAEDNAFSIYAHTDEWNVRQLFSYLYSILDENSQKLNQLDAEEQEKPLAVGIMKILKQCGELMKEETSKWQNPEENGFSSFLVNRMLDIYDSIESGIRTVSSDSNERSACILAELLRSFREAMKCCGIETIPAEGKKFDPNQHYAIMKESSQVIRDGYILDEYQKGFRYHGQMIRPSKVKVSVD